MTNPPQRHSLAAPDAVPPIRWGYWVVESQFLAGAYPGDSDADGRQAKIQTLLDAGIRAFINLMEPDETNWAGVPFVPYDDMVEKFCPEADGHRFAIRDQSIPSIGLMATILDAIDESLAAGKPVYVHCWGGVGRTGTVVGCWLLRHGLASRDNVLDVLARLRQQDRDRGHRDSPENDEQCRLVSDWPAATATS